VFNDDTHLDTPHSALLFLIDASKTPPHGNVHNTHKRHTSMHSAFSNSQGGDRIRTP